MESSEDASHYKLKKAKIYKHFSPAQMLWNELIGPQNRDCIPSNRLPSNRIVMQRFSSMKALHPKNTPLCFYATTIYEEVAVVWQKANIPMKSEKAAIEQILRLLQSWGKFQAGANKSKPGSKQYVQYKDMIQGLCDLADGTEEEMKEHMRSSKLSTWERDYTFYINQKSGVMDVMEGLDNDFIRRQKALALRRDEEEKRRDEETVCGAQVTKAAAKEAAVALEMIDDDSTDMNGAVDNDMPDDPDVKISSMQKYRLTKKPDTVTVTLPRKGFAKVCILLVCQIFPASHASYCSSLP